MGNYISRPRSAGGRVARGCRARRGPSRRAQHRLLSGRRKVAGGGQGNPGGIAQEYAADDRRSRGKPVEKGNSSLRRDRAGFAAGASGHSPGAQRGPSEPETHRRQRLHLKSRFRPELRPVSDTESDRPTNFNRRMNDGTITSTVADGPPDRPAALPLTA